MKTNIFKSIGKRDIIIIAIALIVGLSLGAVFFGPSTGDKHEGHNHSETEIIDKTTYTCSMHPQIRQNEPGDCPICGMDLVPLTTIDTGEETDPNEIQMTQSAIKLAEVQTFIVKHGAPQKSIYLLGKVKPDERNIAAITARFGGRIEKLYINYKGQNVKKGQKLASIYSPDLNTAQRELIEALKYKESNPSFYKATRSKLKLWDLSEEQINTLELEGEPGIYFDILSPISGTVTRRDVAIGDYVKEGSSLFEVIDLSRVWIMFDAYETDLPWMRINDKIEFTLQSLPGKTYAAKVSYIDPFIDANTRVAQVRIEIRNPGLKFKPEMFVNGILQSNIAENSKELLIPKTSILWTGKRAVVYVKVPDRETPSFIYREIELGPEAGSFYVVAQGLNEGEEIASNGVFKIDASAQLAGKPSMMNPSADGGKVSTGHNHGGTPMSDEEMEKMDTPTNESGKITEATPMDFKMQLGEVVNNYLLLKDAFVDSNEKDVEAAAQKTLDALGKVDMTLLKGDAHNQWMKLQKPIEDNLKGIIQMKGIEMKRSHFSIVSDKLSEVIKAFGIHNTETSELYIEFCPMAFDSKGAFWLSETKEIKNPYFGSAMLTCGEVKETLQ